jgi:hypothetical protein
MKPIKAHTQAEVGIELLGGGAQLLIEIKLA